MQRPGFPFRLRFVEQEIQLAGYIEQHRAEITALQILYSRPYRQRLTEKDLKELEEKLKGQFGPEPTTRIWNAYELTADYADTADKKCSVSAPSVSSAVKKNPVARFADLIPLVRFALEQQPVLKPFADSVQERFSEWLMDKAQAGVKFTGDQLAWLNLIRDHIATSCSIEEDDFDFAPFAQAGGLGKVRQLFPQLPALLNELNTVLAA